MGRPIISLRGNERMREIARNFVKDIPANIALRFSMNLPLSRNPLTDLV